MMLSIIVTHDNIIGKLAMKVRKAFTMRELSENVH